MMDIRLTRAVSTMVVVSAYVALVISFAVAFITNANSAWKELPLLIACVYIAGYFCVSALIWTIRRSEFDWYESIMLSMLPGMGLLYQRKYRGSAICITLTAVSIAVCAIINNCDISDVYQLLCGICELLLLLLLFILSTRWTRYENIRDGVKYDKATLLALSVESGSGGWDFIFISFILIILSILSIPVTWPYLLIGIPIAIYGTMLEKRIKRFGQVDEVPLV